MSIDTKKWKIKTHVSFLHAWLFVVSICCVYLFVMNCNCTEDAIQRDMKSKDYVMHWLSRCEERVLELECAPKTKEIK